jgi:hypothetical protein
MLQWLDSLGNGTDSAFAIPAIACKLGFRLAALDAGPRRSGRVRLERELLLGEPAEAKDGNGRPSRTGAMQVRQVQTGERDLRHSFGQDRQAEASHHFLGAVGSANTAP